MDTERRCLIETGFHSQTEQAYMHPRYFSTGLAAMLAEISGTKVRIMPYREQQAGDAIKALSDPVDRHIYTHTGWRELNGRKLFLLPQGALGVDGYEVSLQNLPIGERYALPASPTPVDALKSTRLTIELLDVADRTVTWPLLSHALGAPLAPFLPTRQRSLLHLTGTTGSWKTTLATLSLCMWGDFTDGLPVATWASTPYYLGRIGFTLKDLPFLIDDYKPSVVKDKGVIGLIQNYADGTARGRLNADASLKTSYPVRGTIISTGEDHLNLEASVAARVLTIEISRGQVNLAKVTEAQRSAGELNVITSCYISWIAEHEKEVTDICKKLYFWLRDTFTACVQRAGGGHARVATSATVSAIGGIVWLIFLRREGYISEKEAKELEINLLNVYSDLVSKQIPEIATQGADWQFMLHLKALISSHQVRIESRTCPLVGDQLKGQAPVVAYRDDEADYLHAAGAIKEVKKSLRSEGKNLDFSAKAIYRQLSEKGVIVKNGESNTKVIRVGHERVRVVQLLPGTLDE
jgi:hypothetical protein